MSEEYIEDEELEEEIEEEELEDDRGDSVDDEDLEDDEEKTEVQAEELEEEKEELEEDEEEINVPKYRLDQVIAQRQEQVERVEWLEDQLESLINKQSIQETPKETKKVEEYDFQKSEEEYATLLIEGDTAKASSLRSKIDLERKKEMIALMEDVKNTSIKDASNASVAAVEEDKFTIAIETLESKFPFLNADSDDYNEEAVDTVNTLMMGYVSSGKTKSQALKLAVKRVEPLYKVESDSSVQKTSLGNKKKKVARTKAVSASKRQPQKTTSGGLRNNDTSEVDVSKLSEREFNKLTAKEKRVLRGD